MARSKGSGVWAIVREEIANAMWCLGYATHNISSTRINRAETLLKQAIRTNSKDKALKYLRKAAKSLGRAIIEVESSLDNKQGYELIEEELNMLYSARDHVREAIKVLGGWDAVIHR